MINLRLPYALNTSGELVYVENASKGAKYYCPECKEELLLKIGHIPEGEKYHRCDHFAHKGGGNNHCSETFLHKQTKRLLKDLISIKIKDKKGVIIEWRCKKCGETHKGNLLHKATSVAEELYIDACRPDIVLLDEDNEPIIAIEVVVTHAPEDEVMQYYAERGIVCVQLKIKSYDDLSTFEKKLSNPDEVNVCHNPTCKQCGAVLNTTGHRQTKKYDDKEIVYIHGNYQSIISQNDIKGIKFHCYKCEEQKYRTSSHTLMSISDSHSIDQHKVLNDDKMNDNYRILYRLKTAQKNCSQCGAIASMQFYTAAHKTWYKCKECGYHESIPWPFY